MHSVQSSRWTLATGMYDSTGVFKCNLKLKFYFQDLGLFTPVNFHHLLKSFSRFCARTLQCLPWSWEHRSPGRWWLGAPGPLPGRWPSSGTACPSARGSEPGRWSWLTWRYPSSSPPHGCPERGWNWGRGPRGQEKIRQRKKEWDLFNFSEYYDLEWQSIVKLTINLLDLTGFLQANFFLLHILQADWVLKASAVFKNTDWPTVFLLSAPLFRPLFLIISYYTLTSLSEKKPSGIF